MNNSPAYIKLIPPATTSRILLHSCCAPCSGGILTMLHDAEIGCTIFFYNPNIYPQTEYEKRKSEIIRFAAKLAVPFIDADYEPEVWRTRIQGLENEPEQGKRCDKCFDLRLERTALFAHEHGFTVFATTLAASRWKNILQVNAAGQRAADRYQGLTFWDKNWREEGGSQLADQVIREENFYRQKYCGCQYSLPKTVL